MCSIHPRMSESSTRRDRLQLGRCLAVHPVKCSELSRERPSLSRPKGAPRKHITGIGTCAPVGGQTHRTLEARGSTPLSSTRNPVGEGRRGFSFLQLKLRCGPAVDHVLWTTSKVVWPRRTRRNFFGLFSRWHAIAGRGLRRDAPCVIVSGHGRRDRFQRPRLPG
jgi:hypothetical protein